MKRRADTPFFKSDPTLTGATLIVQMVAFRPWVEIILFLALVIAGMVFQAKTMTGERRAQ